MTVRVITLEQIRDAMIAGSLQFASVAIVADAFFDVVEKIDALEEALDAEASRATGCGVSPP